MELFCFPKMYGGESGAWLWRGRGAPRHLLLPPLLLCTDGRPSPSPSLPPPRAIAVKPFRPNPGVQENLSFPFPSLPEQALGADGDGRQASPPLKHPRKKKPAQTGGIEGNQQKRPSESVADKEIIGGRTFSPTSNPGSKQKQPRKKYGRRSGAVMDSSTEEQQCVMRGLAEMAQRSSVVVVSDWSAEEEFQLTLASPPPRLQDGKSAVLAGEESPPGSPPQELWPQKKKKERRKKVGLDLVNQSSPMSPPKSQNLARNPEEQLDSHPNSSVSNRFCAILAEEESLPGSSPQEVWPQMKKKGRRKKAAIDLVNQSSLMSPPKSQNLVKNQEEQADSHPNSSFSDSFCAILAEEESLPELWIEKKKGRTKKAGIDLVNQSSLTSPPKSQNLARNPEKQSDFHPNSSVSDSFGAILGEDGSLPRSSEELWIEKKEGRRKESGIDSVNRSSLTSLSESQNLARNWEEHPDFHPNSSISDSFCAILAEEKNLSRSLKQLQPEKKGRMKEAGIDSVNKSPLMSLPKSQNLARNREKQQDFGPNCSIINSVCNILAGEKSPPGGLSLTASLLHRQNLARNPEVQQQKQQTQSLSVNPNNSPPENPSPLQTKTGRRKKKKEFFPLQLFTKELDMCAMEGNVLRSLELFDKAVREGGNLLKLGVRQYNAILYLCSSAASGTVKMRSIVIEEEKNKTRQNSNNNDENFSDNGENSIDNGEEKTILSSNGARDLKEVAVKPEVMAISLKRGYEVYRHMLEEGVEPNEATFTAMARLAMSKGDGDLAFEMVKKISENNTNPRLRSYDPALFTYCKNGQVEKAFEVLSHMLMSGLEPEEAELAALLKVSVETGQEDKVYSTLHRLRKATREFSVDTVKVIEKWFRSEVASLAIKKKRGEVDLPSTDMIRSAIEANGGGSHGLGWLGTGKWKVERTDISEKGVCLCCGEQLSLIDIDPLETKKFAESLELLACEKELKSDQFKLFQSWLNKQQHYHAVVDGANVGLFNQKNAHTLNIHQLNSVVTQLQMMDPEKRLPLVILHNRRTKNSKLLSSHAQAILDKWSEANALYATPTGSNDDWYWLYAAVKCKCLLVTNDEMRDHLFQLLGNNFFPKWKERHQVRLSDQNGRLCLHMPPPYSIVMQESEKGSWHVPQLGGDDIFAPREWLCVTTDESIESEILSDATIPDCTQNPSKKDSMRTKSTSKTSPKTTRRRIKKPKSVLAVLAKLEAAEEQCGVSIDFQI